MTRRMSAVRSHLSLGGEARRGRAEMERDEGGNESDGGRRWTREEEKERRWEGVG